MRKLIGDAELTISQLVLTVIGFCFSWYSQEMARALTAGMLIAIFYLLCKQEMRK